MILNFKRLICFSICLVALSGCGQNKVAESEGVLMKNPNSSSKAQDIDVSNEKNNTKTPEWVGNYLELGTYKGEFKFGNKNSEIQISDKIQIPQSELVSILFSTPLNSAYLYEDTKENIANFVKQLENLKVDKIDEQKYNEIIQDNTDKHVIFETNMFFVAPENQYIGVNILTYNNNHNLIQIHQQDKILYCSCESESFYNLISNLTNTKHFDINMAKNIKKVEYLKDNKWIECNQDYVNALTKAITAPKAMLNAVTACPFDLELRLTTEDNSQYNAKYATDDCGTLIIEDTIIQVDQNYINLLKL